MKKCSGGAGCGPRPAPGTASAARWPGPPELLPYRSENVPPGLQPFPIGGRACYVWAVLTLTDSRLKIPALGISGRLPTPQFKSAAWSLPAASPGEGAGLIPEPPDAVPAHVSQDAWGNTLAWQGPSYNPFRYTGQQLDEGDRACITCRARWMDPGRAGLLQGSTGADQPVSVRRQQSRRQHRSTGLDTVVFNGSTLTWYNDAGTAELSIPWHLAKTDLLKPLNMGNIGPLPPGNYTISPSNIESVGPGIESLRLGGYRDPSPRDYVPVGKTTSPLQKQNWWFLHPRRCERLHGWLHSKLTLGQTSITNPSCSCL